MSKKIRFLAGAQCPSCKKIDTLKITIYPVDSAHRDVIECVDCGYQDERPLEENIKTSNNYDETDISIVQLKKN